MTTATTTNSVAADNGQRIPIFQVVGFSLLLLNLFAAFVILLVPLGVFRSRELFLEGPEKSLWLFFSFSFVFGVTLFLVGSPRRFDRALLTYGGSNFLFLGVVSAVEILWIKAKLQNTSVTSVWWLFVVFTVLGAIGVYLPVRSDRIKAKEARRKAEEARLKSLNKERRTSPTIFRFKVRRYYVSEEKVIDCKDYPQVR
jgi:hypothetical protein